jgi:hypothetical protein
VVSVNGSARRPYLGERLDVEEVRAAEVLIAPLVIGEHARGPDHDPQVGHLPGFLVESERAVGLEEHPGEIGIAEVLGEEGDAGVLRVEHEACRRSARPQRARARAEPHGDDASSDFLPQAVTAREIVAALCCRNGPMWRSIDPRAP